MRGEVSSSFVGCNPGQIGRTTCSSFCPRFNEAERLELFAYRYDVPVIA
jgi:hypothetical protein